jgi:hypothetical protein
MTDPHRTDPPICGDPYHRHAGRCEIYARRPPAAQLEHGQLLDPEALEMEMLAASARSFAAALQGMAQASQEAARTFAIIARRRAAAADTAPAGGGGGGVPAEGSISGRVGGGGASAADPGPAGATGGPGPGGRG